MRLLNNFNPCPNRFYKGGPIPKPVKLILIVIVLTAILFATWLILGESDSFATYKEQVRTSCNICLEAYNIPCNYTTLYYLENGYCRDIIQHRHPECFRNCSPQWRELE